MCQAGPIRTHLAQHRVTSETCRLTAGDRAGCPFSGLRLHCFLATWSIFGAGADGPDLAEGQRAGEDTRTS